MTCCPGFRASETSVPSESFQPAKMEDDVVVEVVSLGDKSGFLESYRESFLGEGFKCYKFFKGRLRIWTNMIALYSGL